MSTDLTKLPIGTKVKLKTWNQIKRDESNDTPYWSSNIDKMLKPHREVTIVAILDGQRDTKYKIDLGHGYWISYLYIDKVIG